MSSWFLSALVSIVDAVPQSVAASFRGVELEVVVLYWLVLYYSKMSLKSGEKSAMKALADAVATFQKVGVVDSIA
jgi:hypothetical protein